jgi:hypothetical protein
MNFQCCSPQLIQANLDTWKEASHFDRISLPKLQDFDWALNFKRASSEVSWKSLNTVFIFSCPIFSIFH